MSNTEKKPHENLSEENLYTPTVPGLPVPEKPKSEEDNRPWWKRMKRETGKVRDPYGRETQGVKWSVKGDGFFEEVARAVKGWFR